MKSFEGNKRADRNLLLFFLERKEEKTRWNYYIIYQPTKDCVLA